jgi:hypothetical protein
MHAGTSNLACLCAVAIDSVALGGTACGCAVLHAATAYLLFKGLAVSKTAQIHATSPISCVSLWVPLHACTTQLHVNSSTPITMSYHVVAAVH